MAKNKRSATKGRSGLFIAMFVAVFARVRKLQNTTKKRRLLFMLSVCCVRNLRKGKTIFALFCSADGREDG
jgi:hypothetical protein